MDKDIKEQAGELERRIAKSLGVTVETVVISERLGTSPADVLEEARPETVGDRQRELDAAGGA